MIPVHEPVLTENARDYVLDCINTGWISARGDYVKQFEDEFSNYIGVNHGIAVSNGTAAIETALFAAGVSEGDEVIMPSFTIISSAIGAVRLGAKPVLVDIEKDTWNMDTRKIEAKITDNTEAIMPVHIYGQPVDMDPIIELAKQYNLNIVEDAAEAHGAEYYSQISGKQRKKCGSIGHISAFSFYANKIITTGEGGMVLTDNEKMASKASSYKDLCFGEENKFTHEELGYNFRMTNLQAAIGVAQLENIDEIIKKKRELGALYKKNLREVPGNNKLQEESEGTRQVFWMYALELDPQLGITAKEVRDELKKQQISTRPFFRGLHTQPALRKKGFMYEGGYQNTERASRFGFYLPSSLKLDKNDVEKITSAVRKGVSKLV